MSGERNRINYTGKIEEMSPDTKRPAYCDGTCSGAKRARRQFRKEQRVLKRRGESTAGMGAWWEKPYTCTHVVKYARKRLGNAALFVEGVVWGIIVIHIAALTIPACIFQI